LSTGRLTRVYTDLVESMSYLTVSGSRDTDIVDIPDLLPVHATGNSNDNSTTGVRNYRQQQ
jgi:hypothetical protein